MKDINLSSSGKSVKKILWLLSTSRNAIIVVVCSVIAFTFEQYSESPFKLTGTVRYSIHSFYLLLHLASIIDHLNDKEYNGVLPSIISDDYFVINCSIDNIPNVLYKFRFRRF